jgi:hypothetical protein
MSNKDFLESLRNTLHVNLSGEWRSKYHKDSIMDYNVICQHDEGVLCECRLEKLLQLIDSHLEKKLK